MNLKRIFAVLAVAIALATPATAGQLTSMQLHGLAPGSYAVSIFGLIKMTIYMQRGGSISGVTSKQKRDTGVWTVDGDKLCIRWNRWLKKKNRCIVLSGANGSYSGGGVYIRKI
jgi:hypothetical protein